MSYQFLVTGDLHLGRRTAPTPEQHQDAEFSVSDTWKAIVDSAIDHQVEAVLLTGDVVDKDNRFFEANHSLRSGITNLYQHGIKIYAVAGNHDAKVLPEIADSLEELSNFKLLGRGQQWELISHQCKDGAVIQLAGWSFEKEQVSENPLHQLEQKPETDPALCLLHADLDAASDSDYAPTTAHDLINSGWPVWLLGHIHKPEIIRDDQPFVMYPGSPHALHAKETGNHGPYLLTLDAIGTASARMLNLSPIRYEQVEVSLDDFPEDGDWRTEFLTRLQNALPGEKYDRLQFQSVDVSCTGNPEPFHAVTSYFSEVSERVIEGSPPLLIRKFINNTGLPAADLESLATRPDLIGILAGLLKELDSGELSVESEQLLKEADQLKDNVSRHSIFEVLKQGDNQDDETVPDEKMEDTRMLLYNSVNDWLTELRKQEAEVSIE